MTQDEMLELLEQLVLKYRGHVVRQGLEPDTRGGFRAFVELDDGRTAEGWGTTRSYALAMLAQGLGPSVPSDSKRIEELERKVTQLQTAIGNLTAWGAGG